MSGLRRLFQSARERDILTWMDIYWQGGLYASQSGRWLLKKKKFPLNLFIDLIAFAVQYVSGLCLPSRVQVQLSYNGRVRVVHLRHFSGLRGFGSHFQIKHGPGRFRAAYLRVSSGSGTNFWTREDLYSRLMAPGYRGQIYDLVLFSCLWNSTSHVSTMFWSNLNLSDSVSDILQYFE